MRLDHKKDNVLLKGMGNLGAEYKQIKLKLMPMSCKITFQSEFNCLVVASLSVWHFSAVVQRKISQICKNICHFVKFHQNFVKFVLVKDQTY